jgi:hypothetical protein
MLCCFDRLTAPVAKVAPGSDNHHIPPPPFEQAAVQTIHERGSSDEIEMRVSNQEVERGQTGS